MLPATALSIRILGVQRWQQVLVRLTKQEQNSSLHNSLNAQQSVFSKPLQVPVNEDRQACLSHEQLETQRAREIARLVRAAANHGPYRANCLEQSLVLWCLLKRNGLESEIRFGARKEDDELQAHAWVECLGIALNEDRGVEERYAPFGGVGIAANGSVASGSMRSR
jgi:hypothetical protein